MVGTPPSISDVFLLLKKNHGLSAKRLLTLLLTEKKSLQRVGKRSDTNMDFLTLFNDILFSFFLFYTSE